MSRAPTLAFELRKGEPIKNCGVLRADRIVHPTFEPAMKTRTRCFVASQQRLVKS